MTKENIPFAALTVEEAKNVFRESLPELVDVIKVPAKQFAKPIKATMSIDEALQFFTDNNYPITKSTLYIKVSQKDVPYHKINNKQAPQESDNKSGKARSKKSV